MKQISLTQGQFAIVDDEDFEELNKYRWYAHKGHSGTSKYCAIRNNWNKLENNPVKMHRQIMKAPKGLQVDHINGNDLDNKKCNLRICNNYQNNLNKGPQVNNKTGAKGVTFTSDGKRYIAFIHKTGKKKHIGVYKTLILAARAYDEKAKELHGEFAKLNNL